MSNKPYKLSAVLYGHSLDVRSLAATPENGIISGSRDKTAKYWRSNEFNTGYVEAMTYREHKNFVSSVLYIKPTANYPEGLIITGGNDKAIMVYQPHEPFATFKINEHTDTVCFLSNCVDNEQFLSASWDKTAKLWNINDLKAAAVTFSGHAAVLWSAIQLSNKNIVTACADKTIALWFPSGQQFKTIASHTDCVRGLADLPDLQRFVSVANDALVKIWTYDGDLVDTLYGHNNYIYCISVNKALGPDCFVTGDESNTVRCWKEGCNTDAITLPAQSVWSVACLSNGDVVTGTSDGVIRVFSMDEGRQASSEVLKHFEEELSAVKQQSAQEIGGYKVSDLPGREALYDPGKKAGQIKMVREPSGVVAYSWVEDGDNSHWEKIGDVMGANDKSNENKTLHEGKYYDFVFSVDVEDGKPPLKLPYNKGTDVYEAAAEFLNKNHLPADYLDQVVDFIRTNSQSMQTEPANSSGYVDPFTGASRYVPAAPSGGLGTSAGVNLDPLTGGNSYTTATNKSSSSSVSSGAGFGNGTNARKSYFPHLNYLRFDNGDPKVILGKLKEFNEKVGDGNHKIGDSMLEKIVELCSTNFQSAEVVDGLVQMFEWPQDIIFPAIDVLRLVVRHESNCNYICLEKEDKLLRLFKSCTTAASNPPNTLLILRVLANLFINLGGEEFIYKNHLDVLENIGSVQLSNKNIEISLSTLLLNYTILALKRNDEMLTKLLQNLLTDTMISCKEAEAHFRLMVGLGNLLTNLQGDDLQQTKQEVKNDSGFMQTLEGFIANAANDLERKRKTCGEQLKEVL